MAARIHAFKPKKKPRLLFAWYSKSMEAVDGAFLYRAPGRTVRVTMVDDWRGGGKLALWRDLRYVGRVLKGGMVERIRPAYSAPVLAAAGRMLR